MTERERKRREEQSRRDRQASYTLDEWCDRRRISRAMFYKMDAQGKAPQTHYAGTKRLVSDEADAAWIRAREAEQQQETAA